LHHKKRSIYQVEAVKKFLSDHRIDVGLSIESSGIFMRIPWDERTRTNVQVSEDSLVTLASAYLESHIEMSRRNVHRVIVSLFWVIDTKEFAENILAIGEVLVIRLQSQLDIKVVILIIWNTESIPFEHLTVAHAAIAQEHLRALGKPV
jgi:hypothetical protein